MHLGDCRGKTAGVAGRGRVSAMEMNARFRGYLPVVLDLETGGFDRAVHAVLEIAALTLDFDEDRLVISNRHRWVVGPASGYQRGGSVAASNRHRLGGSAPGCRGRGRGNPRAIQDGTRRTQATALPTRSRRRSQRPLRPRLSTCRGGRRNGVKRSPFHPFSVLDTVGLAAVAYGHTVLSEACTRAGIGYDTERRSFGGVRCGSNRQAVLCRGERRQLCLAAALTSGSSSPDWNISVTMSQPPTSSPST